MQVITIHHSHYKVFFSKLMCDQEVQSCDCVDEETEYILVLAFRGGGYIRCWVLPVIRVNSLQSAPSHKVVERLLENPDLQYKCFQAISVVCS